MSPIALRRLLLRWRRHFSAAAVLCVLATAVAVHHAMPEGGDVTGHHMGGMVEQAMDMCAAAFVAIGTAVAAVALGLILLPRVRVRSLVATGARDGGLRPWPRARAGPALLSFICVSRR